MSGTTKNSRMLGCAYLYPHMIPDPYTNTVALKQDDEFMIVGSQGLWHYVGYDEAVQEVYETGNPVVAAKKLQDLAQGYGSKENIAILVIRFNTDSRPSLCKFRQHKRSMSIDDIEAAAKYAEIKKQWEVDRQRLVVEGSVLSLNTSTSKSTMSCDASMNSSAHLIDNIHVKRTHSSEAVLSKELLQSEQKDIDTAEGEMTNTSLMSSTAQVSEMFNFSEEQVPRESCKALEQGASDETSLKPLPNQRYLKKDAASEWEVILQKRLTEQVKSKELQLVLDGSQESLITSPSSRRMSIVEIDAACTGLSLPPNDELGTSMDPICFNQTGNDHEKANEATFIRTSMTENSANSLANLRRKEPKVKNTIALFENLTSPEPQTRPNFFACNESVDNSRNKLSTYRPINQSHFPTQSRDFVQPYARAQSPVRSLVVTHKSSGSTYYMPNQQPVSVSSPPAISQPRDSQLSSDDDTLCGSDATVIGPHDRSNDTKQINQQRNKQQFSHDSLEDAPTQSRLLSEAMPARDVQVIEIARL